MNSQSKESPFLLDISGTGSVLETIKIHFHIQKPYETINPHQELIMKMVGQAHIPQEISMIPNDGNPFEIEDQSIKGKGIFTRDYQAYLNYISTLFGGKEMAVSKQANPFTLYTCINNLVSCQFSVGGTPQKYTSRNKQFQIEGFYIDSQVLPVIDPNDEFDIAGVMCENRKIVAFFMPKDESFTITSIDDFLPVATKIATLDLVAGGDVIGIDYPSIIGLEVEPDLRFMEMLNGFSESFQEIVDITEFRQKNRFTLDAKGVQFESLTTASAVPRSRAPKRFTIDRSFFCVMYSHTGKPMNISYIPGHLFLKPV